MMDVCKHAFAGAFVRLRVSVIFLTSTRARLALLDYFALLAPSPLDCSSCVGLQALASSLLQYHLLEPADLSIHFVRLSESPGT